jgi:hypothetical protein
MKIMEAMTWVRGKLDYQYPRVKGYRSGPMKTVDIWILRVPGGLKSVA